MWDASKSNEISLDEKWIKSSQGEDDKRPSG
jgi:hypothetical protein